MISQSYSDGLGTSDVEWLLGQSSEFLARLSGPGHCFVYANSTWRDLTGAQTLVGKTLAEAFAGSEGLVAVLDAVLAKKQPLSWAGVLSDRHLEFDCQLDGAGDGIRLRGRDVTDHVVAQQAASQSEAEKADFVSQISHDIRSPITAVASLADILASTQPLSVEQSEYIRILRMSIDTVLGRVTSIVNEARGIEAEPAPADTDETDGTEPSSHHPTEDLAPILVVEDYEPNVLIATTLLKRMGYKVDVATSGRIAVNKARDNTYSLALMDVQMPGMTGLEATQLIRQGEAETGKPRLPVVAMTAHFLAVDRQRCLDAGMDEFLAKPYSADELLEKIRAVA